MGIAGKKPAWGNLRGGREKTLGDSQGPGVCGPLRGFEKGPFVKRAPGRKKKIFWRFLGFSGGEGPWGFPKGGKQPGFWKFLERQ